LKELLILLLFKLHSKLINQIKLLLLMPSLVNHLCQQIAQIGSASMGIVQDIRTLVFINGFTAFILFICLVHVVMRRRTCTGFNLWTWAALANSVGYFLVSLRKILPDAFTIITADGLLVLAAILICRGLSTFCGKPQPIWLDLTALAAVVSYLIFFQPSLHARIVTISMVICMVYLRAMLLVIGPVARLLGEQNILLLVSLGAVSLGNLMWSLGTWFWGDERLTNIMGYGPHQALLFLGMIAGQITVMVGLISINSSRLEKDLISAMLEIKTLQGIIPICSNCKKIRDDKGYWQQVETYVRARTYAEFTHSICPDCLDILYPELMKKV
jgi:hypothetical protein